jgi:hypothetical protein
MKANKKKESKKGKTSHSGMSSVSTPKNILLLQ